MKKPMFLIIFIGLIIIGLSLVRVTVVNSISTTGIELVTLQNEINSYKKQNTLLKEQYLETSSLTNIQDKAKKLGFVEAKSQIYLSTPLPLALKQ
jgi:cell division protein FtsL